ncbi:MAG: TonB-dependent receptor [Desulfosarcinaceae bacterium]|nr:TonB-dependent receptor [Desulfosarcinaceae bacterium]
MALRSIALGGLLLLLSPAAPQLVLAEETTRLDTVVVTAQEEPPDEAQAKAPSAFVTTIPAEDFEETLTSVPEVLEKTAGITVRRYGGLGSYSTASIRGSSAEQVSVFIDGVPLNRGKSGVVNLATIPLSSIETIEVYRGVAPLRFRSSAVGGVINLVTKQGAGTTAHQVGASYGSFDTFNLNGATSGRVNATGYTLLGDVSGTQGDFEYRDDNGTRINTADDETVRRQNNDYRSYNLLGRIEQELGAAASADLSAAYFHKDEGVPGLGSFQSDTANLETTRQLYHAGLGSDTLFEEWLSAEGRIYLLKEQTRFEDLEGEIGTGRQDATNDQLGWGVDTYLSIDWGQYQTIGVLAAFQQEHFESDDPLAAVNPDGDRQRRDTYALGASDEIYLFDERLVLTPQLLYTYLHHEFGGNLPFESEAIDEPDDADYLSPQIGARIQLAEGLQFKANLGRYYRFPNFSELFGDRGGVIGNPDLDPEESVNTDLGLVYHRPRLDVAGVPIEGLHLEAVYYHRTVDDIILQIQTSQRTAQAINIDSARLQGFELSWALDLGAHLGLSGNYTYQDTENTSDIPYLQGNELPGRPRHAVFQRVEAFNALAKLFYEYHYLSENYIDQANLEEVDSRNIHNLGLTLYPADGLSLTVEAKNISDQQISDVLGYPLPGRSYLASVLYKF